MVPCLASRATEDVEQRMEATVERIQQRLPKHAESLLPRMPERTEREIFSAVPDDFEDRDPEAVEGIIESLSSGSAECGHCGTDNEPWLLLGCIVVCSACLTL